MRVILITDAAQTSPSSAYVVRHAINYPQFNITWPAFELHTKQIVSTVYRFDSHINLVTLHIPNKLLAQPRSDFLAQPRSDFPR